jgi:hypothetical protein
METGPSRQPGPPRAEKADVNDRPFLAIMAALVLLLVLAVWQFYSLIGH